MSNNDPIEQYRMIAALEGKVERVLERLDNHTNTLEKLLPKIDLLIAERTELVILKNQVAGITSHVDSLAGQVAKFESMVQRGQGFRLAVNTIIALIAGAASVYSYMKIYIKP